MSAIYMTNPSSTSVLANSVIPCYVNKGVGCAIRYSNNSAVLLRPGYYKISANVTFSAQAAGDVTLTMKSNGLDIVGLTATETVTTPNTEIRTISMQGIIRVLCHEGEQIVSLFNDSDIAITTTNVAITVID